MRTLLTAALPLAAFALGASPSFANQELEVTTTADSLDGLCNIHCSLRDAIQVANERPGEDLIRLPEGDYQIAIQDPDGTEEDDNQSGDLDITDALTIRGFGSASRILGGGFSRLIEVQAGAHVKLMYLTLERGHAKDAGGGVENHGHLLLRRVRIYDSHATPPESVDPDPVIEHGRGGGIANYGELEIYLSLFSRNGSAGNVSDDGENGRGGAIFNRGNLYVRESEFSQNGSGTGGGIYNEGKADISRSLFLQSSSGEFSGGLAIGNAAGGDLLLTNSTISGHRGSVLYNEGLSPEQVGKVRLVNVTIANNQGIGLFNRGEATVRNSLFVGNSDPYNDWAPYNCVNYGKFYRYSASGLMLEIGDRTCSADLYIDPTLTYSQVIEPLADNGGATRTHALRPGSLAIDAGIGSCTRHDQRRMPRPEDGDGDGVALCDLGAYERAVP
ncbi:choice-of-anchor Q domain-containing protein [Pseudomonas indica]|uniref:choice-of-anchor Q domain-containing protein n=1 Tax=Pseudomonas indica TaxID=137658 RepID=UPI003FD2E97A